MSSSTRIITLPRARLSSRHWTTTVPSRHWQVSQHANYHHGSSMLLYRRKLVAQIPPRLRSPGQRLGHSYALLATSNVWDPTAPLVWNRNREQLDWDTAESNNPIMLASSSVVVDKETNVNIVRRLLQWLKRAVFHCYDYCRLWLRGTEIVIRLSPLLLLTPTAVLLDPFFHSIHSGSNILSDASWRYFMHSMKALGPVYIKLCQWVATRRDIFPPHVCDRLSRLHDRGSPHSWKFTKSSLVEAFGDNYEEKGLKVYKDTVGVGSAGQVHHGTVTLHHKDGTQESVPVAVKVLHPRFKELIYRDLWCMQTVADLLSTIPNERIRMMNLPRASANFGEYLKRQADLRIEGDNLQQFRHNFARENKKYADTGVTFPRPFMEWTTSKILVEELVADAKPINRYLHDDSKEGVVLRKELAKPLLVAFMKMILIDNFVHGDLHPGNVLIRETEETRPTSWLHYLGVNNETEKFKKHTIVFLDAGIATTLAPEDRQNLWDLLSAVVTNNGYEAGRLMVERAKYERCSQTPGGVHAFASGIEDIVSEFHDKKMGLTLGAVRVGVLLSRVLDLCREHGVEIDPAMASVVISTLVLEGLGRSLEPNLNLFDFVTPIVVTGVNSHNIFGRMFAWFGVK